MSHPTYFDFTYKVDELVASKTDPKVVAVNVGATLPELLEHPDFLEAHHRVPGSDTYAQHIVYVHAGGLYSIVSLVWKPGQATPIHDHICWCVVGVLEGQESETRFDIAPNGKELIERESVIHGPGSVAVLVPPNVDIHRVTNTGDDISISIHVYGANIGVKGSSINRTYDMAIRESQRVT